MVAGSVKPDIFQEERIMAILDMINARGRVTVKELSDTFDTSFVTIRKDLRELAQDGKVIKTHGGAISKEDMSNHVVFETRKIKNRQQKIAIGEHAARLVQAGEVIFIDASTTTAEMCPHLLSVENLTVITNSLETAFYLARSAQVTVVILGGSVRKETLAVIDAEIEKTFSRWRLDKAFFGGWGYSVRDGMTEVPGVHVQQKRIIAAHSNLRIGLMDSSKVGKGSLDTFIPAKDLDVLITNRDVDAAFVQSMQKLRTQVILA